MSFLRNGNFGCGPKITALNMKRFGFGLRTEYPFMGGGFPREDLFSYFSMGTREIFPIGWTLQQSSMHKGFLFFSSITEDMEEAKGSPQREELTRMPKGLFNISMENEGFLSQGLFQSGNRWEDRLLWNCAPVTLSGQQFLFLVLVVFPKSCLVFTLVGRFTKN